ncbi:hypothetical protein MATL_G00194600 [Megalops atlanticus]|uniref:Myb/SANT-like DNA-binding domain-containing protein n=1 Tax=Megalops atlanticus TaxID=7932 RepID=A0A9D3T5K6_MEGAT|nr:hypothetical protein MATL_G00194600 [Megalops atlanticus]
MDSLKVYDGVQPWTPEEIQAMLSIWADSTVQKELESSVRNEKVFLRISSELAAVGFLRSAKQCREKVKKLKQEYRKLKEHNSRGGPDRKGGKWFNIMDSVLGNARPATSGGGVLNSAMSILEAMSSPSPTSEDSALTCDEPIVEVQILGEEQQPVMQAAPEVRPRSPPPIITRPHQEVQNKLEGATRTKPVFEQIQREMATTGYDRSVEQIINKLKKVKKEYRDQRKNLGRNGSGRPRRNPHFDLLDSVLGDRPARQLTRSLDSATATLEAMVDDTLSQSSTDSGVKRKRASCSSDEWKKIILESDEQYVGVLHKMLESETQHRKDELLLKREEIQLKRADAQQARDEASTSAAIQGQLVSVLGQIAELFRAKQAALHARVSQGRGGPSSAALQTARPERETRRERQQGDVDMAASQHPAPAAGSHEGAIRETQHIIKTESEESVVGQQRTDTAPLHLEPIPMRYEEGQAHSTTQDAAAVTMQQDLLAAQQEQCRLMAENNRIQRTLVRAVSRSNRCMSDLAKSIRAQTAVAASVQDRIVQLLERQEWTNQLLAMKVMGVSSTLSERPQEMRGEATRPSTVPQPVCSGRASGKEATELSSAASDQ